MTECWINIHETSPSLMENRWATRGQAETARFLSEQNGVKILYRLHVRLKAVRI